MVVTIVQVAGMLQREADRLLRDFGITVAQFNVLAVLAPHPEGIPQSEMGDALIVSKANITGLVARMQKLGLCIVASDPDDGRVKRVRLSAKGKRMLDRIDRPYFDEIARVTADLSETQISRVNTVLDRLIDSVSGLGEERNATRRS